MFDVYVATVVWMEVEERLVMLSHVPPYYSYSWDLSLCVPRQYSTVFITIFPRLRAGKRQTFYIIALLFNDYSKARTT